MMSIREIILIEELLKHKPGYRYKAGIMPFPTAIEGSRLIYTDADEDDITTYWASEELLDMYRRGIKEAKTFIPKVGRNDPCSCGSGKKYKECHGKFPS